MEIKDAVRKAMEFARESLGPKRTTNIRLEEIESSTVDGEPVWLITLSSAFIGGASVMKEMMATAGAETEREYKVFTVSKQTGEVISMKIRLLSAPAK